MTVESSSIEPCTAKPALPTRVWPFFSTPFRVFAAVMGPILVLMSLLAVMPRVPAWMRVSAAIVFAISIYTLYRGYGQRVEATGDGVRFRSLRRDHRIRWSDVRAIDRYVPLDRNRTTQYVYVTRLDRAPVDWREIDDDTIQLQDRAGLVEALHARWTDAREADPTR